MYCTYMTTEAMTATHWQIISFGGKAYGLRIDVKAPTVESGYLAHAPNKTTTAAYAPYNETHGLTSSTLLTPPQL